uniref:trans-sulfuration enzyme family protein n=1 Tax=Trinickia soli TaxID=380675 RepID=UPI0031456B39
MAKDYSNSHMKKRSDKCRVLDEIFQSLSPAVHRASTVVFDSLEEFVQRKDRQPDGFSYGVTGTPTARELERRIAQLEGGGHCIAVPSGAAALMTTLMSFVRAGDHLLVSASCYGALQSFVSRWLANLGVDVQIFDPSIAAEMSGLIRSNTRMICLEAPGSVTMEIADIPTVVDIARRAGVLTMMDNTWASPLGLKPLDLGVDFAIEAATKYIGGHSDLLLGAVSTRSYAHYASLRDAQDVLGQQASPDDCFLALRGLETFELRFSAQAASALRVARWLSEQKTVDEVLFPALPGSRGHERWKTWFTGHGCLMSIIMRPAADTAYAEFFSRLRRFSIGASWGGVHSLAAFFPESLQRDRPFVLTQRPIIRLSIGLENCDLLIEDLHGAMEAFAR